VGTICVVMTVDFDGVTLSCNIRRSLLHDFYLLLTQLLDIITAFRFTSFWQSLAFPLADVTAAIVKRPIFLIQGLIDGCINSGNVGTYLLDWAFDIVNGFNELIQAFTQGQITDFFEWVFSNFFGFVSTIIDVINTL